jgi:hypothetical protein
MMLKNRFKIGNKGQVTNLPFILGVVVFFSFMVVLSVSYAGTQQGILKNAPTAIAVPSCSLGVIVIDGLLTCVWNYMTTFLALMSVSSDFALFNGVILFALIASVGWAILSVLRGGGG